MTRRWVIERGFPLTLTLGHSEAMAGQAPGGAGKWEENFVAITPGGGRRLALPAPDGIFVLD